MNTDIQSWPHATVIIAFVLVLVLVLIWLTRVPTDDVLYGFWTAEDDEFCERTEIDSMLLWIGPAKQGVIKTTRRCYLIIMSDVCNQGCVLTYRPSSGLQYKVAATCKFEEEPLPMWDHIDMHADVINGTLEIKSSDGTILARLNKQHDTTNLARMLDNVSTDANKKPKDDADSIDETLSKKV